MKKALILVDLQNDFTEGGALPVLNAKDVIPVANDAMRHFDLVVATMDWHPADHKSFASQHDEKKPGDTVNLNGLHQILWPEHCIQGSKGAELLPGLKADKIGKIIHKGVDRDIDSYSAFFDNDHKKATGLGDYLKSENIEEVTVMGLATDYCVKFTALDACKLGFRTKLLIDGIRGVDINEGDCEKAIAEMKAAGVHLWSLGDLK